MYNLEPQERYEQRKLLRDMTLTEVIAIRQCLQNVSDKIKINSHSQYREKQRYITDEEIMECIKKGMIIEFHQVKNQCRVLLRHRRPTTTDDVCVVVNILSGKVLTAYTNKTYDKHSTLREENYNSDLNVLAVILDCKH